MISSKTYDLFGNQKYMLDNLFDECDPYWLHVQRECTERINARFEGDDRALMLDYLGLAS